MLNDFTSVDDSRSDPMVLSIKQVPMVISAAQKDHNVAGSSPVIGRGL
jgi:hypothetical protein